MTAKRKRFDYASIIKAREQEYQRRMQGLQWKIFEARRGVPDSLIDELRYGGDRQLSEQEAQDLADFLEELLRKGPAHRPKGSLKPNNAAIQFAAYLVKVAAYAYCEAYGRKHAIVSKATRQLWRQCAIKLTLKEYPDVGQIDSDAVAETERKRIDLSFVGEFENSTLHEARRVMEGLALSVAPKN